LFGIGEEEYTEHSDGHAVVHNSYLHSYAELGFFGGTVFFGTYFLSVRTLQRLGGRGIHLLDPELRRLRPYLLTVVAGYAVGLLSLSRIMIVPTYMVPGLAVAFIRIGYCYPPLPGARLSGKLVLRVAAASFVFLAAMYLYTRTFVQWG
jgi:hypothetical protein